jgi:hypothetical protein
MWSSSSVRTLAVTDSAVTGLAGATITAGQVVYLDSSTSTYKLADINSATAAVRVPVGIALNGAASGQPVTVQTGGQVTIGATIAAGVFYYASGTAGGIRPVADNTTGDYPAVVGFGVSTTVMQVQIVRSGVVMA